MPRRTDDEIVELLKSGNFTVAYHDNGYCCLYKGRLEYDDLPKRCFAEFSSYNDDGYLPKIVRLLVETLGGKSSTI